MESVKNIKQLDRAFKEDSDHSLNIIDDGKQQSNNLHALQILSIQHNTRESENLGNLGNLRNLGSSEEYQECSEEEAAKILNEEGL